MTFTVFSRIVDNSTHRPRFSIPLTLVQILPPYSTVGSPLNLMGDCYFNFGILQTFSKFSRIRHDVSV